MDTSGNGHVDTFIKQAGFEGLLLDLDGTLVMPNQKLWALMKAMRYYGMWKSFLFRPLELYKDAKQMANMNIVQVADLAWEKHYVSHERFGNDKEKFRNDLLYGNLADTKRKFKGYLPEMLARVKQMDFVGKTVLDDAAKKGVPVAIITNEDERVVRALLQAQTFQYLDPEKIKIISSMAYGESRDPKQMALNDGIQYLKMEGVPIDKIVYVGDQPHDAEIGNEAGIKTIIAKMPLLWRIPLQKMREVRKRKPYGILPNLSRLTNYIADRRTGQIVPAENPTAARYTRPRS